MPTLGSLIIDIAANTSQLKTDLAGARKELSTFQGNVQGGMSAIVGLGKGLLGLAGGYLTLRTLGEAAKFVVGEFTKAEQQGLRLQAVLRATGNAAGVSAGELQELANSLERTSLFDDKQILAATSQLLTFENISGSALKKAIKLSVDLASLWDGDVSAAAFGLGKALQDPATAAEGLRRAKVKLTDAEKEAIEAFIRLGDVAGAQGVVFKALQDRVGGVAAAESSGLAGAFHGLKEQIEDSAKALGGFVAGPLERWIQGLREALFLVDKLAVGLGGGQGLAAVIEGGLRRGAGLTVPTPLRPSKPLDEIFVQPSRGLLDKEVQDRLTLLGGLRASTADIAALRQLAQADAEALKLPNLALTDRARITKELQSIQGAFAQAQTKEIADLTDMVGLQRASNRDLARLAVLRESDMAALKRGNLALADRTRLTRELAAIESALHLDRPASSNLGARTDLTRGGATMQEEATMRTALEAASRDNRGLSSAMVGVGGERGASPYRVFLGQTQNAAEQWRSAWKTAIEAGAQTMTDFFQRAFEGGMKLRDFLRGLMASIVAPFWALLGQQIAGAIGRGVGLPFPTTGSTGGAPGGGQVTGLEGTALQSSVSVHQNITFAPSFLDAASGDQWLRARSGTIAGIMAQAVSDAPALARHIVANGLRR